MNIGEIPVLTADTVNAGMVVPQAYVIDEDGWKLVRKNHIFSAVVAVKSVGEGKLREGCTFTAAKVPFSLVQQVMSFFSVVHQRYKSEACGYLLYSPVEKEWRFNVPPQIVSGASCQYGAAPHIPGFLVAGTIHSHGSISAFHSEVDDLDEEAFDGLHITIGQVDKIPEFACSIVVQGKRFKFELSEIVDQKKVEIPPEWLDAVSPPKISDPLLGEHTVGLWGVNGTEGVQIPILPSKKKDRAKYRAFLDIRRFQKKERKGK